MAASDDLSYKEKHEQFVSDNEGTSLIEIMLVVTIAPLAVLVRNLMVAWLFPRSQKQSTGFKFLIDFIVLIVPVLLSFTLLANRLEVLYCVLIFTAVGVILCGERVSSYIESKKWTPDHLNTLKLPMMGKRPFISSFRAYVNIAGAISILAVDFQVFPRRFAKAETYGTGLMDIGVGAYVVSNAIVSAEARGKYPPPRTLRDAARHVLNACYSTTPLWFLGLARLAAVKATDYHEHVSEYGTHWNFFFTLAIVKILSTMVLCRIHPRHSWLVALALGGLYQCLLTFGGLTDYILMGSDGAGGRHGLMDANREGICSCLGYLAIYFASVQLGAYLMKQRTNFGEWWLCWQWLLVLDAISWFFVYLTDSHVEPVSRRFANAAYVIWLIAYSIALLLLFLLVDILQTLFQAYGLQLTLKGKKVFEMPCQLEAINRNGLFYFLLLNLQTGLVNLSMQTMFVTDTVATAILILHMFSLSAICAWLDSRNITLRFW